LVCKIGVHLGLCLAGKINIIYHDAWIDTIMIHLLIKNKNETCEEKEAQNASESKPE